MKDHENLDLSKLTTEKQNSASRNLDEMSALEIAQIINGEDQKVALAVQKALPQIAKVIDMVAEAFRIGGRLIYVGAGTSGRMGALDAAEIPPTFDLSPNMVRTVIAGGTRALRSAIEDEEDSSALGRRDLARNKPRKEDVVVGVAASGRTPYTLAAINAARKKGCSTVAIVCNHHSPLEKAADLAIVADVGAEVVSGSTRMKAGSAQKMILNMISTGAMARLGYVYGNLMVKVVARNEKLRERAIIILERAAGVNRTEASKALKAARWKIPEALIMVKTSVSFQQAQKSLKLTRGHVRQAIGIANGPRRP